MHPEMTQVRGKVVRLSDRLATIEVEPASVCPRCATGKGCGAGLLGGTFAAKTIAIELTSQKTMHTGDIVTLSIAPSRLLYASLFAYGLPLVGALTGLLFGHVFLTTLSDAQAAILALCGLGVGFLAGQRRLRHASCMQQFVPELTGRSNGP